MPSCASSLSPIAHLQIRAAAELRYRETMRARRRPVPQPGPQKQFLESKADIVVYGGAAGSGKSAGLLMWPIEHVGNPTMRAVIFRRTTPELTNPGGLWDESRAVYSYLRPHSVAGNVLEHHFPSGAYIKFAHLEYDDTVHNWDSSQVALIGFDQLEQFSRYQFFYMHSRNRSMSGVPAQIRAACNPDADSWLAEFISWWIDQETGFPIKERSGVIRWFVRDGDDIIWGDSREELFERFARKDLPADHPDQPQPTSATFIPGTIYDNPILLESNPKYLARLKSLPRVERERLLGGNWKIRASAGLMFRREWCQALPTEPAEVEWVRYWDLAGTEKTPTNEPDWTVGVRLGRYKANRKRFVIGHVSRMQSSPHKVRTAIKNVAEADGKSVRIGIPQDPGQAGKAQAQDVIGDLAGYMVSSKIESGDKVTRFGPFSAQCEAGNVDYVLGPWNDAFLSSLENFPDGKKDDADACSGAFEMHVGVKGMGLFDFMRAQAEALEAAKKGNGKGNGNGGNGHDEPAKPDASGAAIMGAVQ